MKGIHYTLLVSVAFVLLGAYISGGLKMMGFSMVALGAFSLLFSLLLEDITRIEQ